MIKKLQLVCFAIFSVFIINAQVAPVAGFSLNSTPCFGQPFTPINTTTGSTLIIYQWSTSPTTSTILPASTATNPTITLAPNSSYTLTLVATNTVSSSTYTLAMNNLSLCPICLDTIRMIKNIDTLKTYIAPSNSLVLGCQNGFTGFLTGTNCYKDKEFAQYYPSSSYSNTPLPQVEGVIVLFDSIGTRGTASTQIVCKLYGGTAANGPGSTSLIGSKSANLGSITGATNKTVTIKYCGSPTYTFTTTKIIPYKFVFAAPLIVPANGFFASVQTPYTIVTDSIKIFSNTKTNLSNDSSSWVLQYSNNWRTLRYTKNAKIQLAILPIISCRPIVGLEDHRTEFNSNITLMPNPSNGQFDLVFTLLKQENVTIKISDPLGKLISTDRLENVGNNLINIDLRNRPTGIYFIEVSNGNEKVVKKM
ncbi:MAG: T9SS type A sorting domain-containing protein, partial [Bacteroidetes bacterium]|nr:T9SS type A sorting domain-containing protein [Bacteroidota bacterium]